MTVSVRRVPSLIRTPGLNHIRILFHNDRFVLTRDVKSFRRIGQNRIIGRQIANRCMLNCQAWTVLGGGGGGRKELNSLAQVLDHSVVEV